MKRILFLILLLAPSLASAVPDTSLSIAPAASDGSVITASDENTRNNAISTAYNAHSHTDISQTANTLNVGDATAGNKTITAYNADSNKPFIRYDDTADNWIFSTDGVASDITMSGGIIIFEGVTDDAFETTLSVTEPTADRVINLPNANGTVAVSGTSPMTISSAGAVAYSPNAFLAIISSDQNDIAPNTATTIIFGTEVFDISSDYNSSTGIFTAPKTGKYLLSASIVFVNMDTVASTYEMRIVTSNRTYTQTLDPRQFAADVAGRWGRSMTVLVDMTANDTAKVQFFQTDGTAQTDVVGTTENIFSGYLVF
jgi:hypothetical protein